MPRPDQTGPLRILCCEGFSAEVERVIAAEDWHDVSVAAFPVRCGRPPLNWEELRPLLAPGTGEAMILGRACLKDLHTPPESWPPVRQVLQEACFHLVAGKTLVAEAIERGAYLITPAWLADWRGNLQKLGFDASGARDFFHDFARELVLLDTGTLPDATERLAELATATGLPASRVAVGIDHLRPLLTGLVGDWRQTRECQAVRARERHHARELADHLTALDFLGRLALLKDEGESLAAIEDVFRMLFAPQAFHFVRAEAGALQNLDALPADLARQVRALARDWAWSESGTGFLLRIAHGGETLGILVAEGFAFPEYRDHYLNLALSIAGICALSLENARIFQRVKETEHALQTSEQSLRLAQAIAHVGHWEWNLRTETMTWSDETYRLLGHAPQSLTPNRDVFFDVIHPDDRAMVAERIEHAQSLGGFDIEYRILLPDGQSRIVHGVGKVIHGHADQTPNLIGTLQAVSRDSPSEMLGVIQDITERKELEQKLEQEAQTDPLTECANRRRFLNIAETEFARIRRHGGELSLLMQDLDHFKTVNDRYGHAIGDLTLRTLTRVCRNSLRMPDVIGRLGGEEFAILLPETGAEKALEVAERIRRAVAETPVPLEGKAPFHFTTSIGIATLLPGGTGVSDLLERADQALYAAKNSGRNRVVASED